MESDKKYFYCYSPNLKDYFSSNGLPFLNKDVHKKTGKPYWVYQSGRMIDILLKEYRKNKI